MHICLTSYIHDVIIRVKFKVVSLFATTITIGPLSWKKAATHGVEKEGGGPICTEELLTPSDNEKLLFSEKSDENRVKKVSEQTLVE